VSGGFDGVVEGSDDLLASVLPVMVMVLPSSMPDAMSSFCTLGMPPMS
jgi:hypothetical protein